jgi:photosystem II stability/assembly factor-like uncharacterized protein
MKQVVYCLLVGVSTITFAACGGGGGESTPVATTTPVEPQLPVVQTGPIWTAFSELTSAKVNAIVLDPADSTGKTLYVGASGGVFKTTDAGKSWSALDSGLANTTVYSLAIAPSDPTGQTLYAGAHAGSYQGVYKSTDGGGTWRDIGLPNIDALSLVIEPKEKESNTIFAGTTNNGVYKSTNGGTSWRAVNYVLKPRLANYSSLTVTTVNSLVIAQPTSTTPQALYAGTYWGGVFRCYSGGGSWRAVNTGLTNTLVYALAIDPTDPRMLYAATNEGVYKTINAGASWTSVSKGLPGYPAEYGGRVYSVQSLAVDPSKPRTLYAGTIKGVYQTKDGGISWSALGSGLPDYTSLPSLAIDPISQTFYAGTAAGSVYSTKP